MNVSLPDNTSAPIFCKSSLHSIHASYLFLHQQMVYFLFCRNGGCPAFHYIPCIKLIFSQSISTTPRGDCQYLYTLSREMCPQGQKVFLINSIFQPPYSNFPISCLYFKSLFSILKVHIKCMAKLIFYSIQGNKRGNVVVGLMTLNTCLVYRWKYTDIDVFYII